MSLYWEEKHAQLPVNSAESTAGGLGLHPLYIQLDNWCLASVQHQSVELAKVRVDEKSMFQAHCNQRQWYKRCKEPWESYQR
jgi:hypothetical protein